MIFAHTWEQVLAGLKTRTTRRTFLFNDKIMPCRYQVGKTYAVQKKRGGISIARIEILDVELLPNLREISSRYAKEEGFESESTFQDTFIRINGTGLDEPVYSIVFKLHR